MDFQSVSRKAFLANQYADCDYIYMHGSGGLTDWGSNAAWDLLGKMVGTPAKHVIVGPQTVVNKPEFVRKALHHCLASRKCAKLTFFTRELTSYGLLTSLDLPGVDVHIDEDTAFHFNYGRSALPAMLSANRYPLVVVRNDLESSAECPDNIPNNAVITDPVNSAKSFDHWVRIHALSSQVTANRTHSAIFSAIIGKPTTMYGGNYHKNASIYEYSLKKRGVAWLDHSQLRSNNLVTPPRINLQNYPDWIKNSYKANRLALFVNESRNYIKGMPVS